MSPKPTYEELEKRVADLEQQVKAYQTQKLFGSPEFLSVLFDALFDNMNDAVFIHKILPNGDPGKFVQVNKAASKLLGYTPEELTSLSPLELDDPETGSQYIPSVMKQLRQTGSARFEAVQITKNGRPIDVEVSAVMKDVGSEPVILSVYRNISERKQMENQLLHAHKLEAIGTLAGGIAHDFNNILFPIIGHTEMLLDDFSIDSPVRKSLAHIHTGAVRARELVQQILAFARQEEKELSMMKMQPMIKEALKLIRSTIPATISIQYLLQSDCGPIKADPTQIHQIIMNLATNAYHAMAENGGELFVSLKEIQLEKDDLKTPDMVPGPYACLTVADTGTGMDKDVMGKIFDPFFTTKAKGKGTGMGLSVIHGIVKVMNGDILVYSEPGKGSRFKVYLPVVKTGVVKADDSPKEPVTGGSERILLVDDEKAIITMEKQLLERLGYQVTAYADSMEALEAFRADPAGYDLVMTDVSMPKMPGDKLAAALITIRPDIPILLFTGFSERITDGTIKDLGVKGLLMKPLLVKEIARKLREILG
jgi:PAS domain S-box-containing protein